MLLYPFLITLTAVVLPVLRADVDPTYFWFRDYSDISPSFKLFLRISIILVVVFHGSLVLTDLLISMGNVAHRSLFFFESMSNPKSKNDAKNEINKSAKAVRFSECLLEYAN